MKNIATGEYRRQGMRLFFENSSGFQMILAALLGSLLFSLSWAILATLSGAVCRIFSIKTVFIYGIAAPGASLIFWVSLPFRLLHQFVLVDIYFSLLFLGAVLMVLRCNKGGFKSSSPRYLYVLFFFGLAAGLLLLWLMKSTHFFKVFALFEQWYWGVLAGAIFCSLLSAVLLFSWPRLWFWGLLLYHRYFVFGPHKVTRARIESYFANFEPW